MAASDLLPFFAVAVVGIEKMRLFFLKEDAPLKFKFKVDDLMLKLIVVLYKENVFKWIYEFTFLSGNTASFDKINKVLFLVEIEECHLAS